MIRNRKRRPRLAITGSAGVGKTTLGNRLADLFGVPFIREGMRARIEAGLDLHTLGADSRRALVRDLLDEALRQTRAAVDTSGGFVADRCSLDFAAFWLYYGFSFDGDATRHLFTRAEEALAEYDRIVVLPWGAIPLRADGVRSANPWLQLHYQSLLEGLLFRRVESHRILRMPLPVIDLEERVRWICTHLQSDPPLHTNQ